VGIDINEPVAQYWQHIQMQINATMLQANYMCPKSSAEELQILYSVIALQFIKSNKVFFDKLNQFTHGNFSTVFDLFLLYDQLYCELNYDEPKLTQDWLVAMVSMRS